MISYLGSLDLLQLSSNLDPHGSSILSAFATSMLHLVNRYIHLFVVLVNNVSALWRGVMVSKLISLDHSRPDLILSRWCILSVLCHIEARLKKSWYDSWSYRENNNYKKYSWNLDYIENGNIKGNIDLSMRSANIRWTSDNFNASR